MPSEALEPSVDGLPAFVDALPTAELHVDLEGSIAPSTLLALARSQPDLERAHRGGRRPGGASAAAQRRPRRLPQAQTEALVAEIDTVPLTPPGP